MKFLVVILFFLFSFMAYSQPSFVCKDGSTPNSIVISLPVILGPNCATGNIQVYYCCSTDPITGRPVIDIVGATIFDWRCFQSYDLSGTTFWDLVRGELFRKLVLDPSAPCHIDPNSIGNCNNPTYITDLITSGCWKFVSYFGSQTSHLVPCGEGFCKSEYELCYDYSYNPPLLMINKLSVNSYISNESCNPGPLFPFPNTPINPNGPIVPFDYTSPCVLICGGNN